MRRVLLAAVLALGFVVVPAPSAPAKTVAIGHSYSFYPNDCAPTTVTLRISTLVDNPENVRDITMAINWDRGHGGDQPPVVKRTDAELITSHTYEVARTYEYRIQTYDSAGGDGAIANPASVEIGYITVKDCPGDGDELPCHGFTACDPGTCWGSNGDSTWVVDEEPYASDPEACDSLPEDGGVWFWWDAA